MLRGSFVGSSSPEEGPQFTNGRLSNFPFRGKKFASGLVGIEPTISRSGGGRLSIRPQTLLDSLVASPTYFQFFHSVNILFLIFSWGKGHRLGCYFAAAACFLLGFFLTLAVPSEELTRFRWGFSSE